MRWCGCSDDHQGARTNPAMSAKWDTYIVAKRPKAHLAERHWRQRSRLLLPNRTRLNAVRAFCVKLDTLAVGSSWSPCNFVTYRYGKDKLENPLCSYLNSSIGILALLGNRTNRVPSYSRFSIDDQRKPAVPDFAVLGDAAVTELAAAAADGRRPGASRAGRRRGLRAGPGRGNGGGRAPAQLGHGAIGDGAAVRRSAAGGVSGLSLDRQQPATDGGFCNYPEIAGPVSLS